MNLSELTDTKNIFLPKIALTLSEVLITLGIIGLVAAMTLPTLISNIQEYQFQQSAKSAYSKLSQVIQSMQNDSGGSLTYYNNTAQSFKPVFINYFKVIQDCNWDDCVPYSAASDVYTSLSGSKANTTSLGGEGQFITADGMFFNIQNNPASYPDIIIVVDVNGYKKPPNIYGKDTFAFSVINDKLLPMGATGTAFSASGFCNKTTNNYSQGIACMYYVMCGIDY